MGWRGEKSVSVVRTSLKKGIGTMEVQLTDDQKASVRPAIDSGESSRERDALRETSSHWEPREREVAEILAAVDQAEASFARGEGRRIPAREEAAQLADGIKRRGLA